MYKKNVLFLLCFSLSILVGCGGGGGGGSTSSSDSDIITYCVTNEATQDVFSFSKKPFNKLFDSNSDEDTDVLIQGLPPYLEDLTSDYLFVSYVDNDGSIIEELYLRDNSDLSVEFGFHINANAENKKSINIEVNIVGYEGWITEGRYIEGDQFEYLTVFIDSTEYINNSEGVEFTSYIDKIEYVSGRLSFVDMRFSVKSATKSLTGHVRWSNNDIQPQEGPVAIPDSYWVPPSEIQDIKTTHLYLVDDKEREFFYTQSDTAFTVKELKESRGSIQVQFDILGSLHWWGSIFTMDGVGRLERGLYSVEKGFIEKGMMYWFYDGIYAPGYGDTVSDWPRCVINKASYVIDGSEYTNDGVLQLIDMRFDFECEDGASFHGRLFWDKNDPTQPSGPAAIPENLWDKEENRSINDGNYLYLEGDNGEFISQGLSYEYNYDSAQFIKNDTTWIGSGGVSFEIWTHSSITLTFIHMSSISKFEKGFYGPFNFFDNETPALGQLNIAMHGRGASTGGGWFVIDHVVYDGNSISEIIVRFEFVTDYLGRAVRGKLIWSNNSELKPSNPSIIPENLWNSPLKLKNSCAVEDALRLQIQYNSWWNREYGLGASENKPVYAVFSNIVGGHFKYEDTNSWEIIFSAQTPAREYRKLDGMGLHINGTYLQERLEVGFYDDIWGDNPATGSINLSLDYLSCYAQNGWMAIDDIAYGANSELTKINLRFGFSCNSEVFDSRSVYGELDWQK